LTVDTVIPIGSVTKQFTAAAILQLRDQGKLGLDVDITKWLPDFETRGNKVTLRRMLDHTSGITDLIAMPELRAMQLMRNPALTLDARLQGHQPLSFPVSDGGRCRPTATPTSGSSVSSSKRRAG
jgi:CubicO group peptidase (beta-lactamase class C family)